MANELQTILDEAYESGDPVKYGVRLAAQLRGHPFYREHPEPALAVGDSVFDLRLPVFTHAILSRLSKKIPSEVAAEIEATFAVNKIQVETFAFVENVTTAHEIDLGGNVTALPESVALSISFAEAIAGAKGPLVQRDGLILRAITNTNALKESSAPPGHPVTVQNHSDPGKDAIRKAIRLITLEGPTAPQARVWTFRSCTNLGIFEADGGFSFEYPQRLPPGMPPQITDKAKTLLPAYDALPSGHRKRVNAAIARLNLGVSETAISDRIVEAAIAIEAILSDDEKQELTYRHRLRSALLLETDYEKRRAVKKLVRQLYDERSKLVHTGLAGDADSELAMNALELAARLIERILEIGRIPDWDTIELTGGDASLARVALG